MSYRWLTRTAAAIGVAAVTFIGVSPAWADVTMNIPLNPAHEGTTAEDFGEHGCDGFEGIGSDQDGWHFVLPQGDDDFYRVTLEFTDNNGAPVTVVIISKDENSPSTGPGWEGFIDNTGSGQEKHVYLITEAGWTLVDGNADIVPSGDKTPEFFNLSHTCPGTPPPPSSPPPSSPPVRTTPPVQSSPPASSAPPELPTTGVALGGLIALAAGLVIGGTLLLIARRRRDGATDGGSAGS